MKRLDFSPLFFFKTINSKSYCFKKLHLFFKKFFCVELHNFFFRKTVLKTSETATTSHIKISVEPPTPQRRLRRLSSVNLEDVFCDSKTLLFLFFFLQTHLNFLSNLMLTFTSSIVLDTSPTTTTAKTWDISPRVSRSSPWFWYGLCAASPSWPTTKRCRICTR